MAKSLRCRLGRHRWRSRERGDALTYFCQGCGKTLDSRVGRDSGAGSLPCGLV